MGEELVLSFIRLGNSITESLPVVTSERSFVLFAL